MAHPPPGDYYGPPYTPAYGHQIHPQDYRGHQAIHGHPRTQMSQSNYAPPTGHPSSHASPYPVYQGNASTVLGHVGSAQPYTNAAIPQAHARLSPAITPMPIAGSPSFGHTMNSSGYGRHVYSCSGQQFLDMNNLPVAGARAVSPPRPKTRNPQLDPGEHLHSLPFNQYQYRPQSSYSSGPVMIPTSPYQPQNRTQTGGGCMRRPHTPAEESPYFRPLREGESLLLTPFHPKRPESYEDDFEDDDDDESLDYDFTTDDRQSGSSGR